MAIIGRHLAVLAMCVKIRLGQIKTPEQENVINALESSSH
jgi:hypothetical protein